METPHSLFTPEPKTTKAEQLFLKYRMWIYGLLSILLGFGIFMLINPPAPSLADDPDAIPTDEMVTSDEAQSGTQGTNGIVVDISGGVLNAGVYLLPNGSIVEDGIKAAGGFSRIADLDTIAKTINRAALVDTHSKIYIPKKGDNLALLAPATGSALASTAPATMATASININTATTSELDILPGVGPVTAQRIIDYRIQNGDYKTIEEIKNVSGISDAKFDQMKDLITIN